MPLFPNIQYPISNIFLKVFFLIVVFFIVKPTLAVENNKFGIHLAQPHFQDLKAAADLVNSSGGDWGYVTLVIQENDRNHQKWQEIFDYLRELHLIPIIRLATVPEGPFWQRPRKDGIREWVDFLDSLNWVVKNRYIILFNEPNHGSEWGGEVDPKDYGEVALAFAKALKEKNQDFFVMLAGLDASSPHQPPKYWDEEVFLKSIFNFKFEILNYLDGWVSHSYPNPNFSGNPWDFGRGTVRTYQWELELLKSLGVNKNLPVFITETGWRRDIRDSILDIGEDRIANNYKAAFEQVWLPDEKVKAVTPFILNYQSEPFLGFSWRKYQSEEFYPQYHLLQSVAKIKGEPEQIEKGEINFNLPKELVEQSTYQFKISLKNLGQGIWEANSRYSIFNIRYLKNKEELLTIKIGDIGKIKPFEEGEVSLFLETRRCVSCYDRSKDAIVEFVLKKGEKEIIKSKKWYFKIIPLPSLKFKINLFPKLAEEGDNFEIQIFDERENLVFKKGELKVKQSIGYLRDIQNIIPGEKYRLVVLKPYYLPRQTFLVFKKGENKVSFKPMLPLDFNADGRLSLADGQALVKNFRLLRLFVP